jgi:hypothetical protein
MWTGCAAPPGGCVLLALVVALGACEQAADREAGSGSDPESLPAEASPGSDSLADVAVDSTPRPAPATPEWSVDFDRYGPIPLGVPLAEAVAAAPGVLEALRDPAECQLVGLAGRSEDVSLMVSDGHVTRVDVHDRAVTTRQGARIGDTEERIRELYGERVEVRPHKYTDGRYLIITPADVASHRLVFETDQGRVTAYRAGVLPQVEWVEGCG